MTDVSNVDEGVEEEDNICGLDNGEHRNGDAGSDDGDKDDGVVFQVGTMLKLMGPRRIGRLGLRAMKLMIMGT